MTELVTVIMSCVSLWAPALVGVLSIVFSVIYVFYEVRKATKEFKNDQYIKELADELKILTAQNRALSDENRILIDQITKIQNYVDKIRKGGT